MSDNIFIITSIITKLFDDDTSIGISSDHVHVSLNEDLTALNDWAHKWPIKK